MTKRRRPWPTPEPDPLQAALRLLRGLTTTEQLTSEQRRQLADALNVDPARLRDLLADPPLTQPQHAYLQAFMRWLREPTPQHLNARLFALAVMLHDTHAIDDDDLDA